jgi:hypothetical protein
LASEARREERAAGMQLVVVVGELGEQHRERVGVVLGDVDLDFRQVAGGGCPDRAT